MDGGLCPCVSTELHGVTSQKTVIVVYSCLPRMEFVLEISIYVPRPRKPESSNNQIFLFIEPHHIALKSELYLQTLHCYWVYISQGLSCWKLSKFFDNAYLRAVSTNFPSTDELLHVHYSCWRMPCVTDSVKLVLQINYQSNSWRVWRLQSRRTSNPYCEICGWHC